LIGPFECGIVNSQRLKKVLRPLPRLDRLKDDGIALATDRYRRGFKTEFLGQRHCLTSTRFQNFNRFMRLPPDARERRPGAIVS
jgi:hypothetical protein